MHTHGIRFLADRGMAAALLHMCNEIDAMRGVMPREPAQPRVTETFVVQYPCYSVEQGRTSLIRAMQDRQAMILDGWSYKKVERRIRIGMRSFGADDEAIVAACAIAAKHKPE